MTKEPDLTSNVSVIHNLGNSDHSMVTFTTHLHCKEFINNRILRDYKNGDYDSINSSLALVNWDTLLEGSTAECWRGFSSLLHQLEEEFVPLKRSSGKADKKKPIWMTYKALNCVRRKRRVFHKYKDVNHPAVRSACRAARSELRRSCYKSEEKLSSNIKQDKKPFFAYSRSRTKSKVHIGPISTSSGNMTNSGAELVNSFNDHFVNVFTAEDTSSIPLPDNRFVSSNRLCSDISFNQQDVLDVLTKLRIDTADGSDELSARFLTEIKDHIVYPLFIIFRKS